MLTKGTFTFTFTNNVTVCCRIDSCVTNSAMQSSQMLVRHHTHYNKPTAPRFTVSGDRLSASGRAVSLLTLSHTADIDSNGSQQQRRISDRIRYVVPGDTFGCKYLTITCKSVKWPLNRLISSKSFVIIIARLSC